jgi:hypothetical protein
MFLILESKDTDWKIGLKSKTQTIISYKKWNENENTTYHNL